MFVALFVSTQASSEPRTPAQVMQGTVNTAGKSGAELFVQACAARHGHDGKGKEASEIGFDVPTPDFADCQFAPRDPNADWVTVAHEGGPARGFSSHMPGLAGPSVRRIFTGSSDMSRRPARLVIGRAVS